VGANKSLELSAREAVAHGGTPGRGDRYFKDVLRKVDRNRRGIHGVHPPGSN
jgi:hypothetical protein